MAEEGYDIMPSFDTVLHNSSVNIKITCPCNIYPIKPHFYILKLGLIGVYLFFLIFYPKHKLWVLIRIASLRQLYHVPTVNAFSKIMEKN